MKKIDQIKKIFELSNVFGKKIYCFDILSRITHSDIFYKKKNQEIIKYLENKYNHIIREFDNIDNCSENIKDDCPIWIFWAQGFDNAPELVQGCLKQLSLVANDHKIVILNTNNYKKYVNIPEPIIEKYEKGIITLVNFTDILRVSLLAEHGGIWMDSTIYLADSIDPYLKNITFFTINNYIKDTYRYVSNYKWTGFFMACGKNNLFLRFLRAIFYEYWKNENYLIDYFLIDYLIIIGYNNNKNIRKILDNVLFSNPEIYWLNKNMSQNFNKKVFDEILKQTKIFKLNWRYKAEDNLASYYHVLFQKGIVK